MKVPLKEKIDQDTYTEKTKSIQNFHMKSHLGRQVLATIPSCLVSVCAGMTFGITAVMLPQLRHDDAIHYDPRHESWIAAIASVSMIFGSLSSGPILDTYGRKTAHIILGIPYIIGWTVIACASSTTIIIVGRLFTGLSSGANKSVMLVYIGELASPKVRTFAMVVPSIILNVGILFTHIFTFYLEWRISSYVCIVPAILISASSLFLKESPLWLISKGRTEEGIEIFRWFRGTDDASEAELKTVLNRNSDKTKMSAKDTFKILCSISFIKPTLTLLVVVLNIMLSGVYIISYYSQDVFQQTFSGSVDPFIMMVVMDCEVSVVSLSICFLGKYMSKKKSYLICNFGISLFLGGLVASLVVGFERFTWVPVACMVIYFFFCSSITTLGWTFIPELLPSHARGLGSGISIAFSSFSLFVVVKFMPAFMIAYGPAAVYAFCGISTVITGIILFFILPDTDGKTLQSIEDGYNKKEVEITSL